LTLSEYLVERKRDCKQLDREDRTASIDYSIVE